MSVAMNKDELQVSMSLVGAISFVNIVLPSIEKIWETDPGDEAQRAKIRNGQVAFSLVMFLLIINVAMAGYPKAAIFGSITLALSLWYQELALRTLIVGAK